MKRIISIIWNILETVGQYRYQQVKRRGYGTY
jgi:hypothetical protein